MNKLFLPLPVDDPKALPDTPPRTVDLAQAIDRNVRRSGDCLVWSGAVNQRGIPIRTIAPDIRHGIHRLQYVRHFGPIPEGMAVQQTCGNRRCLEPGHLELRETRGLRAGTANMLPNVPKSYQEGDIVPPPSARKKK